MHHLILYRGRSYKFVTKHDRSSFEILTCEKALYQEDGLVNSVCTLNNDVIFTPTENTPNKLILRTTYKNDRVVTISVMNNHFYGNVSSGDF